jgi:hypothetical protein
MLLRRRFLFIAPVKELHDKHVDQNTDKQQQEKENDKPGQRRHLSLFLRSRSLLDPAGNKATAALMFENVAVENRGDGDDGDR